MQTTTQQQIFQQPLDPSSGRGRAPAPPPPLPGTDGRPVRASYQLQLKVQGLLMTMTDEEKMALGHSISDLIVDCEFAGTTCTTEYVRCYFAGKKHFIIFLAVKKF